MDRGWVGELAAAKGFGLLAQMLSDEADLAPVAGGVGNDALRAPGAFLSKT